MKIALLLLGMAMTSCSDRDFASLKPSHVERSFSAELKLQEAEHILQESANESDLKLNLDPNPKNRPIPRDYLATIIEGKCMIFIEGQAAGDKMRFTVSLDAVSGTLCPEQMVEAFNRLQESLKDASKSSGRKIHHSS